MPDLTSAQRTIIRGWLESTGASLPDDDAKVAALNAIASPAFYIYRTSVTQDEVQQNNFDWTRVDNLSVGKARIWDWMFNSANKSVNPSKAVIRNGINAVWVGTAADRLVRDAVYLHCYRAATVAEKLLSSGAGTAIEVNGDGSGPAVPSWEGPLTQQNVSDAQQNG